MNKKMYKNEINNKLFILISVFTITFGIGSTLCKKCTVNV